MILVKLKDEADLEELRETYNLTGYNSFLQTTRHVLQKLVDDEPDTECQLQFPIRFLAKSYQSNPTIFARMVAKKMHVLVKAHYMRETQELLLHASYVNRPRSFTGKIIAILQDPRARAVDIPKTAMPKSFREQPHTLTCRLAKKVGRLKLIDLGVTFRYAKLEKPEKPSKTKPIIHQYISYAYVRKEFA